jgi:hypothetical protein
MTFIPSFRDILFEAWERTEPCPDGFEAKFCPSCLLIKIVEVGDDLAWVAKQKERYERLNK